MKKILLSLFSLLSIFLFSSVYGTTIGIHGIQSVGADKILQREQDNHTTLPLLGTIFDSYDDAESKFLSDTVHKLGTGRIYHISISPYGFTAAEVAEGRYDKRYNRFFDDIKKLNIKVVFRTMHEMNGGRYSWASAPEDFKRAWKRVRKLARIKHNIQSDQLLFSLSFNSQDLPTTHTRPTQESPIEFCSEWKVKNKWRCPRKADYYPGDRYVDLIGVTLYNRWRSRPDRRSQRKTPQQLLDEDGLLTGLQQRGKPIIIDELGTTAVEFSGTRSQSQTTTVFQQETSYKNSRIRQRRALLKKNSLIKAIVYFNIDATEWATQQILWQADWSIIASPYHTDYREGTRWLTLYNKPNSLLRLFK